MATEKPDKKKDSKKNPPAEEVIPLTPEQEEDKEIQRTIAFQRNSAKIAKAYLTLAIKKKVEPSLENLAAETGLCTKTIWRHQQTKEFGEVKTMLKTVQPMMVGKFIAAVSESGSDKMWDLYFTLANDEYAELKRSKKVDVTTKGEKITDAVNYSKLSTETLQELLNASSTTENKS